MQSTVYRPVDASETVHFLYVLQIVSELKLEKSGPILGTLMTKAREWQYANALEHASVPDSPPKQLVVYLQDELSKRNS